MTTTPDAPTAAVPEMPPTAYALEPTFDYPDTTMAAPVAEPRDGRARWALSLAALVVAVAALVFAGAHGARLLSQPSAPVSVAPARPATPSEADKDRVFLANLHQMAPHLFNGKASAEGDTTAVDVGRKAADRIAGSSPKAELDRVLADAARARAGGPVDGIPSDSDLAVFIYAAMLAYCPQSLPQGSK